MSGSFNSMFSSRSFIVSGLTFNSPIHFKLIFVSGVRQGFSYIFYTWIFNYSSTIYWKDCLFSIEYFWLLCQTLFDCLGLFLGFQLFNWSICLLLCQYNVVLITITWYYNLKSGSVVISCLVLHSQDYFGYHSLLWFQYRASLVAQW